MEPAPLREGPDPKGFRTPIRAGVAAVLIFIGLGLITGRIFSINQTNMLATEQTMRGDFQDELKYLLVTSNEEGNASDESVYANALRREFSIDPATILGNPTAVAAAKAAKEKASRKWPIQARRENWDSRRKEVTTQQLVKKAIGETKYRLEDLAAELKHLAVLAHKAGKSEDVAVYLDELPNVLAAIEKSRMTTSPAGEELGKDKLPPPPADAMSVSGLDATQLDDPKVVAEIEATKLAAKHHWPIELRLRDTQRIRERYSTEAIVDLVSKETVKQRPFLSGNDRSRWLTVRSLVEHGTFEVNAILEYEPSWDSVDIVSHKNAKGEQKLYSSKPPLQAVLIAAPYWILHKITGWTLGDHPFELGRILLFVVNVLPLGFGWWCCARLLDEWCEDDLSFVVVLSSLCFATLITTFSVAINNHTWGAISASATCFYAARCWRGSSRWADFLAVGFWAAFTFTCELPAASLVAMVGLFLLWRSPKWTIAIGTPAVLFVLLAYFGTNYIAHGKWSPPYSFGAGDVNTADSRKRENWYDYDFVRYFDGKKVDSYWRKPDNPLDQGESNLAKYVFHATVGHHGIFSLTPLLLLAIPGLGLACASRRIDQRLWGVSVSVVSLACIVFYLFLLDTRQRNYGGTTSAFRQLLWLHPLWMIATATVMPRLMRSKAGIGMVAILAMFSALAVGYPNWNPWSQTWIWNWMLWMGLQPIGK